MYAPAKQVPYVEKVFQSIPQQLAQKFKWSSIEGDYRKKELVPTLDL